MSDDPRPRNALVHGLTSRMPDGEAEVRQAREAAERWTLEFGPTVEPEGALVRAAAEAHARIERIRVADEAALRIAADRAVERWNRKRAHAARRRAQELSKNPVETIEALEASSAGCDWLVRRWVEIDGMIARGQPLHSPHHGRAEALFGFVPTQFGVPVADPRHRHLLMLLSTAAGRSVDGGPTRDEAVAELRGSIAAEAARVEALRDHLASADAIEAEAVAANGLVDLGRDGELRRRYRREAFSEMTRSLNLALRLRNDRLRREGSDDPNPADTPSHATDTSDPNPADAPDPADPLDVLPSLAPESDLAPPPEVVPPVAADGGDLDPIQASIGIGNASHGDPASGSRNGPWNPSDAEHNHNPQKGIGQTHLGSTPRTEPRTDGRTAPEPKALDPNDRSVTVVRHGKGRDLRAEKWRRR